MKNKLTVLQIVGFLLLGAVLYAGFNLADFPAVNDFSSLAIPTALKVIFSTAIIAIGVLFGTPSKSVGPGLTEPLYTNGVRTKWILFGFLGALATALVLLM